MALNALILYLDPLISAVWLSSGTCKFILAVRLYSLPFLKVPRLDIGLVFWSSLFKVSHSIVLDLVTGNKTKKL